MTPYWTVMSYLVACGLAYLLGFFTAALLAAGKRGDQREKSVVASYQGPYRRMARRGNDATDYAAEERTRPRLRDQDATAGE